MPLKEASKDTKTPNMILILNNKAYRIYMGKKNSYFIQNKYWMYLIV